MEAIRNVFEYAGVDECLVFAQALPKRREAEIAFVDEGRGIQDSLAEAFSDIRPEDAVLKAIQPGITRSVTDEGRGKWENSGYGLYVMSEMARRGQGSFVLWSSGIRLMTTHALAPTLVFSPFRGTGVKIRIQIGELICANWIKSIVDEGESKDVPGAVKKASASKSQYGGWHI